MVTREEVLWYVRETYGTEPEILWQKHLDNAVLRHKSNGKWYGLLMTLPPEKVGQTGKTEIDVLNLKCRPELMGSLREKPEIAPAYHMNKEHWLSLILEKTASLEEASFLIDTSYELTKN